MAIKYLAGYDGSAESRAAVELAARMAEPAGADVVAVNVYPPGSATYWIGVAAFEYDEIEAEYRREAEQLLEELDVPAVTRRALRADSAARGLNDFAESTGAELLAVGATHHGPFGRLAPGSVGMHLLHGAPCPVLVAPAGSGERPLRTIGVAYDGREEARAALRAADLLAVRLDARLLVLGANQPLLAPIGAAVMYPPTIATDAENAFTAAVQQAADGTRAAAEARTMIGPPNEVLTQASADVDLLVTGSRGYGAVRGVVLGSVSRHLVDHAECPVMVVPRP